MAIATTTTGPPLLPLSEGGGGERMLLNRLDPFLQLDEFTVSTPSGFLDHPHRGLETVTYMLEGDFTYQDFAGNKGTLRTGDMQWMKLSMLEIWTEVVGPAQTTALPTSLQTC